MTEVTFDEDDHGNLRATWEHKGRQHIAVSASGGSWHPVTPNPSLAGGCYCVTSTFLAMAYNRHCLDVGKDSSSRTARDDWRGLPSKVAVTFSERVAALAAQKGEGSFRRRLAKALRSSDCEVTTGGHLGAPEVDPNFIRIRIHKLIETVCTVLKDSSK